jgi:hypothetical protein
MQLAWLVALAACGCRGILGIEEPLIETAPVDAPAVCASWHPRSFDPCALGPPLPALRLAAGEYSYDTSIGKLSDGRGPILTSALTITQPDGSELAVLSVDALTIDAGATIHVAGMRPLLVVSWSTIAVDGAIDASSHLAVVEPTSHIARTTRFGPGAVYANGVCGDSRGKDGVDATTVPGAGGGGGGGFAGAGGAASDGGATAGGAAGAPSSQAVLRAGCPGGRSGLAGDNVLAPATRNSNAEGGAGGGALRLVAHDSIAIGGAISANGSGGAGAPLGSSCGGGGGGAGGDVELEAPIVAIAGTVTANGGGGGGGGNDTQPGQDGTDGIVGETAAPGGPMAATPPDPSCGAAGGDGSARDQLDGKPGSSSSLCGGGGGGGGAGFIFVVSPALTAPEPAKISPAVSMR